MPGPLQPPIPYPAPHHWRQAPAPPEMWESLVGARMRGARLPASVSLALLGLSLAPPTTSAPLTPPPPLDDWSRVPLTPLRGEPGSEYINASFIPVRLRVVGSGEEARGGGGLGKCPRAGTRPACFPQPGSLEPPGVHCSPGPPTPDGGRLLAPGVGAAEPHSGHADQLRGVRPGERGPGSWVLSPPQTRTPGQAWPLASRSASSATLLTSPHPPPSRPSAGLRPRLISVPGEGGALLAGTRHTWPPLGSHHQGRGLPLHRIKEPPPCGGARGRVSTCPLPQTLTCPSSPR